MKTIASQLATHPFREFTNVVCAFFGYTVSAITHVNVVNGDRLILNKAQSKNMVLVYIGTIICTKTKIVNTPLYTWQPSPRVN